MLVRMKPKLWLALDGSLDAELLVTTVGAELLVDAELFVTTVDDEETPPMSSSSVRLELALVVLLHGVEAVDSEKGFVAIAGFEKDPLDSLSSSTSVFEGGIFLSYGSLSVAVVDLLAGNISSSSSLN